MLWKTRTAKRPWCRYPSAHSLTGQGVGHKDHPAIYAAYAVTLVGKVIYGELNFLMVGKWLRYEFTGRCVHGGGRLVFLDYFTVYIHGQVAFHDRRTQPAQLH